MLAKGEPTVLKRAVRLRTWMRLLDSRALLASSVPAIQAQILSTFFWSIAVRRICLTAVALNEAHEEAREGRKLT